MEATVIKHFFLYLFLLKTEKEMSEPGFSKK